MALWWRKMSYSAQRVWGESSPLPSYTRTRNGATRLPMSTRLSKEDVIQRRSRGVRWKQVSRMRVWWWYKEYQRIRRECARIQNHSLLPHFASHCPVLLLLLSSLSAAAIQSWLNWSRPLTIIFVYPRHTLTSTSPEVSTIAIPVFR